LPAVRADSPGAEAVINLRVEAPEIMYGLLCGLQSPAAQKRLPQPGQTAALRCPGNHSPGGMARMGVPFSVPHIDCRCTSGDQRTCANARR